MATKDKPINNKLTKYHRFDKLPNLHFFLSGKENYISSFILLVRIAVDSKI